MKSSSQKNSGNIVSESLSEKFDVVIPAHQKDLEILNHCIKGIKKNAVGLRRVIVVSKEKYTDEAEWFDEAKFPFSFQEISHLVHGRDVGWHYQQLLKLYSSLTIPDILPSVLVLDADTVFLRKVKFFEDGLPLYNLSKDRNLERSNFHQITLSHIKEILPEMAKKLPEIFEKILPDRANVILNKLNFSSSSRKSQAIGLESGICHHMLLQKHVIKDLFERVEKCDGSGKRFYEIFLSKSKNSMGVAEYNLYFYFLISHHPDAYKIRLLKYKNTADFRPFKERMRRKYHYCSYHSYMRDSKRNFFQKIHQRLFSLFSFEQWNIGWLNFPIHEILEKECEVSWFSNPPLSKFYADPFGFEIAGKKFIIFEDYLKYLRRGRIAIAEWRENKMVNSRIVLDDKKHLSYPFIIRDQSLIYMVCESYKSKKLVLYKINQESLKVEKVKEIFSDQEVVDPTIFHYQGKFWLFCTTRKGADSELCIFSAESLLDEFKPHDKNPVKLDKSSSRPAGNFFKIGNEIYRPAQNCSQTYGGSIVINRVTQLDEENFSEEFVKEIKPNPQSPYGLALHTLSQFGDLTLVDGKRRVFVIYKPLISLLFRLRKILLVN